MREAAAPESEVESLRARLASSESAREQAVRVGVELAASLKAAESARESAEARIREIDAHVRDALLKASWVLNMAYEADAESVTLASGIVEKAGEAHRAVRSALHALSPSESKPEEEWDDHDFSPGCCQPTPSEPSEVERCPRCGEPLTEWGGHANDDGATRCADEKDNQRDSSEPVSFMPSEVEREGDGCLAEAWSGECSRNVRALRKQVEGLTEALRRIDNGGCIEGGERKACLLMHPGHGLCSSCEAWRALSSPPSEPNPGESK